MRYPLLLLAAAGWLGLTATAAEAGKGVKKSAGTAQSLHGLVTNVNHTAGKPGHGSFTIRTVGTKKKGKAAAAGAKATVHTHTLYVGPGTQFSATHKGATRAAHFAALKPGEHVTVQATDGHAQKVSIHVHAVKKKAKKGKSVVKRVK